MSDTPTAEPVATSAQVVEPPDLRRLRLVGFIEGLSSVALFCVAMPLKYLAHKPEAVRVVGMLHGLLFLLFVALIFLAGMRHRWSGGRMLVLLIASVIPFGPFFVDHRIRNWGRSEG
jgi:integral membrane protein